MTQHSYFWTVVFFMALGTLTIRFSLIAVASRVQISARTKQLFSYIPAALLPAFIAPAVFFHQGHVNWLFGKERLFILVGATAVAYFTRSTLATIVFGLGALYLVTQVSF